MNVSKRPGSRNYHLRATVCGKRIQRSLGTADKRVAMAKAVEIVAREERRGAGLWSDVHDAAARPIREHVSDFLAVLRARGNSAKHLSQRERVLNAMIEATRAGHVSDIEGATVARWLGRLADGDISITTRNAHLSACKQFTRWLVADRRAPHDPLLLLKPGNRDTDRRLVRRALTRAEVASLLEAAERGALEARSHQRLSETFHERLLARGKTRALVYEVALRTGLRRSETAALQWRDLDLSREPEFTVRASESKARREVTLPLDERVAMRLREYKPRAVLPKARVFPSVPNTKTFYSDLARAGLDKGEADRRVDFHSLRHTFVTRLAEKGVHPKVAQTLARHSTMELTMAYYTDLRLLDLRGALAPRQSRRSELLELSV